MKFDMKTSFPWPDRSLIRPRYIRILCQNRIDSFLVFLK